MEGNKETTMQKVKWWFIKNREKIIGVGIFALYVIGISGACGYAAKKYNEQKIAEEEAEKANREAERLRMLEEAERYQREIRENPANQIRGGGYVQEDNIYETDWPNAICNDVPLTSMGEFGQDMIERLKNEYPDWEEIGPFNPDKAQASIIISFNDGEWDDSTKDRVNYYAYNGKEKNDEQVA